MVYSPFTNGFAMRTLRDILRPSLTGSAVPSAILWTSLAGIVYAGSSFVLLMLASHLVGDRWTGILGIAIAMSQQLYTLGAYNMVGYQASDVAERTSFPEYATSRLLTVGAMLPAALAWIAVGGLSREKVAVFLFLLVQRASEAFCSVCTGRYQQKGRLDVGGRIEFAKNTLSLAAFAVVIIATRRVVWAAAAAAAIHVSLFFLLDRAVLPDFGGLRFSRPGRGVWRLLGACAPLAATAFLLMYVNNGAKYAVDAVLGEERLAEYNALYMFSFVVPIAAMFFLNPYIAPLGEARERHDRRRFRRIVFWQGVAILAMGAVAFGCAATFGAPLLSLLFGMDLRPYRPELCLLVGSGVFLALYQLEQTILTVRRRQAWSVAGIAPAALFVFFASRPMAAARGLCGASLCFLIASGLLAWSFLVLVGLAALLDGTRNAATRCPVCERPVSPAGGACPYCGEPLPGRFPARLRHHLPAIAVLLVAFTWSALRGPVGDRLLEGVAEFFGRTSLGEGVWRIVSLHGVPILLLVAAGWILSRDLLRGGIAPDTRRERLFARLVPWAVDALLLGIAAWLLMGK